MSLTTDQKTHLRHVRLNLWEMKMIGFIAQHEGRIDFDFRNVQKEVRRAMVELHTKQLVEIDVEGWNVGSLVTASLVEVPKKAVVRLTDQGRAIMSTIDSHTIGQSNGNQG